MRRIAPEEVADEVYAALRPAVIAEVDGGGYQIVRLTIRATGKATRPSPRVLTAPIIMPMPLLL